MEVILPVPEIITRRAIETLKNKLLEHLSEAVMKLVFFGSRKEGTFTPESDIDILVVVKNKNKKTIEKIFELSHEIERDLLNYEISLSIHILSEKEYLNYKDRNSEFIQNLEKSGEVVYERVFKG